MPHTDYIGQVSIPPPIPEGSWLQTNLEQPEYQNQRKYTQMYKMNMTYKTTTYKNQTWQNTHWGDFAAPNKALG